MALFLKFFYDVQGGTNDPVTTHRHELHEEGFGGSALEIQPGLLSDGENAWLERYGSDGDEVFTPLQESIHKVSFAPILDSAPGLVNAAVLDTFKSIATAGPRDFQYVHKHDGTPYFTAWVIPRSTQMRIHDGMQFADIEARPRLRSLDGQLVAANSGHRAASVLIAEYLGKTGISVNFVEEATAAPAAETGDPLDTLIPERAFWRQGPNDEAPARLSVAEALSQILESFNLTCRFYDNKWRLSNAGVRSTGTTITQREYDTSGAFVSSAVATFFVDLDSADFEVNRSALTGTEPIREARVTYDAGPFSIGDIVNAGFELWVDEDTPVGWTDSDAASEYLRFDGLGLGNLNDAANRFSRGIIGSVTPAEADPTEAEKKVVATTFTSQDIGQFTTGSAPMRLSWLHMIKTTFVFTEPLEEQAFVRIKYVAGASTYFWVASGPHSGTFQIVTGDAAKHPITDFSVNYEVRTDFIDILSLPGAGTLTIELGAVVRGDFTFKSGDNTIYVAYDTVQLDRADTSETGEEAREYVVSADGVVEGLTYTRALRIGDGPFSNAIGTMLLSDGVTLTGNWERKSAATQRPHAQMVAAERIILARRSRARIRFPVVGSVATAFTPLQTIGFDGLRLWPTQYELGGTTFDRTLFLVETPEDTASATTDTDAASAGTGGFSGALVSIFDVISGGPTRLDQRRALQILAATGKTVDRAIQFVDAFADVPTREYLTLWASTDSDDGKVESDTTLILRSTAANGSNIQIATAISLSTPAGDIDLLAVGGIIDMSQTVTALRLPNGTTAQEPTPLNGMVRYDTDTDKLRGVEGGSWTDLIGGGGSGDVVGPASAVDNRIATFDTTTGKLIQDSGRLTSDFIRSNAADVATGKITFEAGIFLGDNDKIEFGVGIDGEIFSDGNNLIINSSAIGDVRIMHGAETMAIFKDDQYVELYYNNAAKFITTTGGIDITGEMSSDTIAVSAGGTITGNLTFNNDALFQDGDAAIFGVGLDLQIFHDAGAGVNEIKAVSGDLHIKSTGANKMAVFERAGEVQLYYNASKKLNTANAGVQITGSLGVNAGPPGTAGHINCVQVNHTSTLVLSGQAIQMGSGSTQVFVDETSDIIKFKNLPTSDPGGTDEVWNDSGTLKIT